MFEAPFYVFGWTLMLIPFFVQMDLPMQTKKQQKEWNLKDMKLK